MPGRAGRRRHADAVLDAMRSHPVQWPERFEKAHTAVCRFICKVADPDQLVADAGLHFVSRDGDCESPLASGSRVLTGNGRWGRGGWAVAEID